MRVSCAPILTRFLDACLHLIRVLPWQLCKVTDKEAWAQYSVGAPYLLASSDTLPMISR